MYFYTNKFQVHIAFYIIGEKIYVSNMTCLNYMLRLIFREEK